MEECAKEKREIQLLSGVSTVHIKLKDGKKIITTNMKMLNNFDL